MLFSGVMNAVAVSFYAWIISNVFQITDFGPSTVHDICVAKITYFSTYFVEKIYYQFYVGEVCSSSIRNMVFLAASI